MHIKKYRIDMKNKECEIKQKALRYRSRKKKKNHANITANFPDEKNAREFEKEIRKAIRRTKRLLNNEFSFEMHLNY